MFKWWKNILKEEVELYPTTLALDPILRPILTDLFHGSSGRVELQALLDAYDVDLMWQILDESKQPYMKVMSWLSRTAPGDNADKHLDFVLHNYGFVVSELREDNQSFIDTFKGQASELKPELFRGSYIRAAYTYYRYVLKGMTPQPSDIGDIHHVFYVPYSSEVVQEKSMAGILHQIREEKGFPSETQIKSIRFIRDLPHS